MSTWGLISEAGAATRIQGDPKGAALMISKMSFHIVELENKNKELLESLVESRLQADNARVIAARLQGWQERVREIDKLPSWNWERDESSLNPRPNNFDPTIIRR